MSEQSVEQTESNTADNSGFTPPATQAELNKIIADRVARERGKFADYTDLQAKAAQFDAIEKASQTDAERAAARITDLETELESVRRDALRRKIAGENGITDQDDIDLFLTGGDEETLAKQAKRLAARQAQPADDEAHETVADSLDLGTRGGTPKKGKSTADLFAAAIDGSFTR